MSDALLEECVTPRAGVWIETNMQLPNCHAQRGVTPRAGVWIETVRLLRERVEEDVTPRAGVWIETSKRSIPGWNQAVTPRAGVWIETLKDRHHHRQGSSLPVRECGLKLLIPVYAALECGHSP